MTHGEALGFLMKGKRRHFFLWGRGQINHERDGGYCFGSRRPGAFLRRGSGGIFPLAFRGDLKKGEFFVAEADEYATCKASIATTFFWQNPEFIICTNIEYDHPDIYPNLAATKNFSSFFPKNSPAGF